MNGRRAHTSIQSALRLGVLAWLGWVGACFFGLVGASQAEISGLAYHDQQQRITFLTYSLPLSKDSVLDPLRSRELAFAKELEERKNQFWKELPSQDMFAWEVKDFPLRSQHLIKPWLSQIQQPPLLTIPITSAEQTPVALWRVQVLSENEEVLWQQEGQGQPPAQLAWDGRTRFGDTLDVGVNFYYSLRSVLENKQSLFTSSAFYGYTALAFRDHQGAEIKLLANRIFNRIDDSSISDSGQTLLQEVATCLLLYPANFLVIKVSALSEKLGLRQAQTLTDLLAQANPSLKNRLQIETIENREKQKIEWVSSPERKP
jgi:hypothetical protein